MKRIHAVLTILALATVAGVAFAQADAVPWVSNHQQYLHKKMQRFDAEARFATVDAGSISTGTFRSTGGTGKFDFVDAGVAHFNGRVTIVESVSVGKCTLNGASPSVCTDTVVAGSHCVCTIVGGTAAIAAKGVACDVSSTTLTATSANAATEVVNWHCF